MSLVPQLGPAEILVLAVLVLLVVGPKDLPTFLHSAGKFAGKARRLADEFRAGLRQVAREAELEEMRKEIEELKKNSGAAEMTETMQDIDSAVSQPAPAPASEPPREASDG
ncbi:MAG: Sec-independent protein translocase protein TatB [Pseudomonadota bacterium]